MLDLFEDRPSNGRGLKNSTAKSSGVGGSSSSKKNTNELVFKIVSDIKGNNCGASIDYIARNNKYEHDEKDYIPPTNEDGKELSKKELEELKADWKQEFSDPKLINSRNMTHIVISVDIEQTEKNKQRFHNATRDFLSERFGSEGFKYIFVQHNDTDKPHVHILVNNNSLLGKKLRMNMDWYYESRLMVKEHLKNHGINQEATFKRDRQLIKEKSKELEKSEIKINNWFDAKLKNSANNDVHFNHLKKQFEMINELKKEMKSSERFTTQQKLELSKRVQELKADVAMYNSFRSRTEANRAVHKMIKEMDASPQAVKDSSKLSKEKLEARKIQQEKQFERQLYFHAKAIIKAESITKDSDMTPKEKRQILSTIKERKAFLESKGIDIKKLEQDQRVELSSNERFKMAYRITNKVLPLTDKQIKKEGQIDFEATKKRFYKALEVAHSAKKIEPNLDKQKLEKHDEKTLDAMMAKTIIELESRGFPAKKMQAEWKEVRELKDVTKSLSESLKDKNLSREELSRNDVLRSEINEKQKQIFELEERIEKNPPNQLGKKEKISLSITLRQAQLDIDRLTESMSELKYQVKNLEKGFEILDEKITEFKADHGGKSIEDVEKNKAFKQAYAMSVRFYDLEEKSRSTDMLEAQKEWLSTKIDKFEGDFAKRDVNIVKYGNQLRKTENVRFKVREMENMSMNRVKAIGYDRVEDQIKDLTHDTNIRGIKDWESAQMKKVLKEKALIIQDERNQDFAKLQLSLSKAEALHKEIEKLQSPEFTKNLTALERLNNNRLIESKGKEIMMIVKESKPLLLSASKDLRAEINKTIRSYEQSFSSSIERGR